MERVQGKGESSFIELTEEEKHLCKGTGFRLALFEQNKLIELFNPFESAKGESDDERFVSVLRAALDRAEGRAGAVWVECKDGKLYQPVSKDEEEAHFNAALSVDCLNWMLNRNETK